MTEERFKTLEVKTFGTNEVFSKSSTFNRFSGRICFRKDGLKIKRGIK